MTQSQYKANIVITSDAIFTGKEDGPFSGFIAIRGNKIVAVGEKLEQHHWIGSTTKVYSFTDQLVMPGIHDNHVFFTGYMSMNRGVNLSNTRSADEALSLLVDQTSKLTPTENLYGFGWNKEDWGILPEQTLLDKAFPNRPVIIINRTKTWCWMNQQAINKYQFTPDHCSAEARAQLLHDMLQERSKVKQEFLSFCETLASRGVTSIKDIGFDEYELLPILSELEKEGQLPIRIHFALQPVLKPLNLSVGERYLQSYKSDHLRFQGYKIMVDGVVADHTGDMLVPYADMPGVTNLNSVDYQKIEDWVLEADRRGLKCCLTAEGDAAIRRAVTILEKCSLINGLRDARHSISDLEYPHPEDIRRMGEYGIFAEVYAQILLLNPSYESAYMAEVVGKENESRFYDYRTMIESGINVTIGTDLPLFMTSVPDSIYAASKRLFPKGSPSGGWYPEHGMTVAEILKAWTVQGSKHNFMENKTGSIEVGKYADIAVFDRNLFEATAEKIRDAKVVLTIADGEVVYDMVKEKYLS